MAKNDAAWMKLWKHGIQNCLRTALLLPVNGVYVPLNRGVSDFSYRKYYIIIIFAKRRAEGLAAGSGNCLKLGRLASQSPVLSVRR